MLRSDTRQGRHGMVDVPSGPPRRTIAVFNDYAGAERAVDHLSDHGFPVERVAIIGTGLRYVEQVTSRMTTGRAALLGAAQGAFLGAIFGLLLSIFFTVDPNPAVLLLVVYGIVTGAIIGAIFGALAHLATGGARDFASLPTMGAERYEVVVDEDVADRGGGVLRSLSPAPSR
jgi:hypothetical protein